MSTAGDGCAVTGPNLACNKTFLYNQAKTNFLKYMLIVIPDIVGLLSKTPNTEPICVILPQEENKKNILFKIIIEFT